MQIQHDSQQLMGKCSSCFPNPSLPDVDMALWSKIDLAAQHSLPAVTSWQLTHLTALQVPVTLLDLGVTIVEGDVPHNLKYFRRFNDLQTHAEGLQAWQCSSTRQTVRPAT